MTVLAWLAKRPLPLGALDGADLALDLALRAWSERRQDGLLPARCTLDTPQLRLLLPEAEWLEPAPAAAPAPLGRLAALAEARAADPAAARPRLGVLLLEDQRTVRFTGSPLLQDLLVAGPLVVERWRQLLLPTSDDGVRVRELWQLCRLRAVEPPAAGRPAAAEALRPPPAPAVPGAAAAAPDGADAPGEPRAWRGTPGR
jgi:hypothetical protein